MYTDMNDRTGSAAIVATCVFPELSTKTITTSIFHTRTVKEKASRCHNIDYLGSQFTPFVYLLRTESSLHLLCVALPLFSSFVVQKPAPQNFTGLHPTHNSSLLGPLHTLATFGWSFQTVHWANLSSLLDRVGQDSTTKFGNFVFIPGMAYCASVFLCTNGLFNHHAVSPFSTFKTWNDHLSCNNHLGSEWVANHSKLRQKEYQGSQFAIFQRGTFTPFSAFYGVFSPYLPWLRGHH